MRGLGKAVCFAWLATTLVVLVWPGSGHAGYIFDLIAHEPLFIPPGLAGFVSLDVPAINDAGLVAFRGSLRPPGGGGDLSGIFIGDGTGPVGAPVSVPIATFGTTVAGAPLLPGGVAGFGRPAISDHAVAYRAIGAAGSPVEQGIFAFDFAIGQTRRIVLNLPSMDPDRPNPFGKAFLGEPSLNNLGPIDDVVFKYENEALASAIIANPLPGVGVVQRNRVPVGPNVEFLGDPVINNALMVAAIGTNMGLNSRTGVLVGTALADPQVAPNPFYAPVSTAEIRLVFASPLGERAISINNSGEIAVIAGFDPQGPLLVVISPTDVEALFDTSGPFTGFIGGPAINDRGLVAFEAMLADGGEGIFVHEPSQPPNAGAIPVIETGDILFGQQVLALRFGDGGRALNNAGELVFFALLTDDSRVIVRAVPTPEPTGLALVAAGIVGLVLARAVPHPLRALLGRRRAAANDGSLVGPSAGRAPGPRGGTQRDWL